MNKLPQSRRSDLVVQELKNEILIYDLKINKAFCLNETSALIWQLGDGKKSVLKISQILSKKLNKPMTEDVIWLAVDNFKKENLLEQSKQVEIDFNGLSRREVIRKLGLASMFALPVISVLVIPNAANAASCIPGNIHLSAGNASNPGTTNCSTTDPAKANSLCQSQRGAVCCSGNAIYDGNSIVGTSPCTFGCECV